MKMKNVGLVAAAAMAVGAFLPWAKITAPFIGTVTRSGIEGGDGWFFVGVAVLAAVCANSESKTPLAVLGALAAAFSVYEIVDVNNRIADVDSSIATASVGVGLWLCAAGAAATVAASFMPPSEPATVPPEAEPA